MKITKRQLRKLIAEVAIELSDEEVKAAQDELEKEGGAAGKEAVVQAVKDAEDGSRVRFKVPDGELVFTAKMIGDVLEAKGFFARYTLNEIGQYERNTKTQYHGEAMYLLEGRDASLLCSENQLKAL